VQNLVNAIVNHKLSDARLELTSHNFVIVKEVVHLAGKDPRLLLNRVEHHDSLWRQICEIMKQFFNRFVNVSQRFSHFIRYCSRQRIADLSILLQIVDFYSVCNVGHDEHRALCFVVNNFSP
jgi:hypothetical protein